MRWIEIKIKAFLEWILSTLIEAPDVKVSTVVMFIQEFSNCLSDIERERVSIQLQTISQFSLKQITIDGFLADMKVYNYESALNKLNKLKEIPK